MRLSGITIIAALTVPLALVRCVGDSSPTPDAATDATANDGGADAPASDGSSVACQGTPSLFQPNGKGPFCVGAIAGNHCNLGDHCCMNTASNVNTCAPSCDGGLDVQCYSVTECGDGGLVCCGRGTIENGICTYPVISGFKGTACESLCSNEFVSCANSSECSGKTCTPVRALDEAGASTTNVTTGACL